MSKNNETDAVQWKLKCQYLLDILDQQGFSETDLSEEDEIAIKGIRSEISGADATIDSREDGISKNAFATAEDIVDRINFTVVDPAAIRTDIAEAIFAAADEEHYRCNSILRRAWGDKVTLESLSAGPDLLEALKDLTAELSSTGIFADWPDLKAQVEAAIAKAEGHSHA